MFCEIDPQSIRGGENKIRTAPARLCVKSSRGDGDIRHRTGCQSGGKRAAADIAVAENEHLVDFPPAQLSNHQRLLNISQVKKTAAPSYQIHALGPMLPGNRLDFTEHYPKVGPAKEVPAFPSDQWPQPAENRWNYGFC